MNYEKLGKSK